MFSLSKLFAGLTLMTCLFLAGCGDGAARSVESGEIEQYLKENPDAATPSEEPEGMNDPVVLPDDRTAEAQ